MKVKNTPFKEKAIAENYVDLFARSLRNSPMKGMTIGEMKEISGLLDTLENSKDGEAIDLDAKDIKKIKEHISSMKWVVFSQELIDLDAYLGTLV